jgi:hypothetical protein
MASSDARVGRVIGVWETPTRRLLQNFVRSHSLLSNAHRVLAHIYDVHDFTLLCIYTYICIYMYMYTENKDRQTPKGSRILVQHILSLDRACRKLDACREARLLGRPPLTDDVRPQVVGRSWVNQQVVPVTIVHHYVLGEKLPEPGEPSPF